MLRHPAILGQNRLFLVIFDLKLIPERSSRFPRISGHFGLKFSGKAISPIFVKSGCSKSPTVGFNSTFFNTSLQCKLRASQRNCEFILKRKKAL